MTLLGRGHVDGYKVSNQFQHCGRKSDQRIGKRNQQRGVGRFQLTALSNRSLAETPRGLCSARSSMFRLSHLVAGHILKALSGWIFCGSVCSEGSLRPRKAPIAHHTCHFHSEVTRTHEGAPLYPEFRTWTEAWGFQVAREKF